jgi:tetratricopeptide (TPR) repeat protein
MRSALAVALLTFVCLPVSAQHFHHVMSAAPGDQLRESPCTKKYAPPKLEEGLQILKVDVTGNPAAKKYFDQGMTWLYGFNYEDAMRNFEAARAADSTMAMAAWGVALAAGPNINLDMDGPCAQLARTRSGEAVEKAATQPGIKIAERALISALRKRYEGPTLDAVAYSVAMRRTWENAQFDPDISALYAESLLDLRPWGLFDDAQRPALDTDVVYKVLTNAISADRKAVGANHYWIHATEASAKPGDALASADLLRDLIPASGHLVHMPSHVYFLMGNYAAAVKSNTDAVAADTSRYAAACEGDFAKYSQNGDCMQLYYGHYLSHNHYFRAVAAAFLGTSKSALESALATRAHAGRFVVNEPGLQRYMTAPYLVLVMNRDWNAVMGQSLPDPSLHILGSIHHWARGVAYATNNKPAEARAEYDAMKAQMSAIPKEGPTGWGNNSAANVLTIADAILQARMLWTVDRDVAIEHLKLAVTHEDALVYDEPPQWLAPARESLGGAYLQAKNYGKAKETFLEAKRRHPGSGRALYGLLVALTELKEPTKEVQDEFNKVWNGVADYQMSVDALW